MRMRCSSRRKASPHLNKRTVSFTRRLQLNDTMDGGGNAAPESLVLELTQEILLALLPFVVHQPQRRNLHFAVVAAASGHPAAFQLANPPLRSAQVVLQLFNFTLFSTR